MNASAESAVQLARRRHSTRRRRIAIEFFLPPLVATVLAGFIAVLRDPLEIPRIPWSGFLGGGLVILVVAYVVASIPSALFTIVMEVAFAKGLAPGSWAAVALAAGLGLLSGAGIVRFDPSYGAFNGLVVLGGATGAIVGVLVKAAGRRADDAPSRNTSGSA